MNSNSPHPRQAPGPRSKVFGFDLLKQSKTDYLGHIKALKAEFGDVVQSQIVHEKVVDIHHPELIRALLVDNADALIRWERGIEVFANIHGQSVLVTEGDPWKRQRRMLQPGFSPKRMLGYSALMCKATEAALNALEDKEVINLDFGLWAHQLTMDVILQTLFGQHDASTRDSAIAAVATLSQVGMKEMFVPMSAPEWMPHKAEKRRAKRTLDHLIRSNIHSRRQQASVNASGTPDVLAMLLSVRDEGGDGGPLSDEDIRDQCMTIFLAGHETTALGLSWWAWLLAEHPTSMLQAQKEVEHVLAGQAPSYEKLAGLRYLNWSLKEALRLYPPASSLIGRRTLREVEIGEWCIPKGAIIRITPWEVHRDARWFPEPSRFIPERFDESNPPINRHSFMAFGTGPRACIGTHFALTEMTLIAAYLLQRFSFQSISRPTPKLDVLLIPEGGITLQFIRRSTAHKSSSLIYPIELESI